MLRDRKFLFVWKLSNVPQKAQIQSEAHLS